MSPASFELELTESALMQPSADIEAQFRALRSLGLGLSLDDFGTGYSSLVHLKRLPLTRLQDRPILRAGSAGRCGGCGNRHRNPVHRPGSGSEVVAEGSKREAQRDFLLQRHCPIMQGYLFARPSVLPTSAPCWPPRPTDPGWSPLNWPPASRPGDPTPGQPQPGLAG
ncbi:MAG: EAL domain-containing protein [Zoogloea sp.]|nr:EAL domain-containing protein [Zoogloea sp.]